MIDDLKTTMPDGQGCPFVSAGFMLQANKMIMPGVMQNQIVFMVGPCAKQQCKFWHKDKNECRFLLWLSKSDWFDGITSAANKMMKDSKE